MNPLSFDIRYSFFVKVGAGSPRPKAFNSCFFEEGRKGLTREKSFHAGGNHSAQRKIVPRTVENIPRREKSFRARKNHSAHGRNHSTQGKIVPHKVETIPREEKSFRTR